MQISDLIIFHTRVFIIHFIIDVMNEIIIEIMNVIIIHLIIVKI